MALSNKTSRLLMQQLASAFVLMERNLQFLDEQYEPITTGAPFPFALVYIGSRTDDFFTATQDLGVCCLIKNPQPKNRKNSFCNYCGKTFVAKRSTAKFCGSTCRSLAHKKSKINYQPLLLFEQSSGQWISSSPLILQSFHILVL